MIASRARVVASDRRPGGKLRLRVVNAGDSRTLLGRRDGTIVDGGGTDQVRLRATESTSTKYFQDVREQWVSPGTAARSSAAGTAQYWLGYSPAKDFSGMR